MSFTIEMPVRFAHVDAAGIVFYPRYFEMLNAALEEWFAARTGIGFAELHLAHRLGIPTVKLDSSFVAPSRLGDALTISIDVQRIGRSSCEIAYRIRCGEQDRVHAAAVVVCMDLDAGRPVPWTDEMRAGLESDAAVTIGAAA